MAAESERCPKVESLESEVAAVTRANTKLKSKVKVRIGEQNFFPSSLQKAIAFPSFRFPPLGLHLIEFPWAFIRRRNFSLAKLIYF